MGIRSIIINRLDNENDPNDGTYSLLVDGGTGAGSVAKVGLINVREALRYTASLIDVMEGGGEPPLLIDSNLLTRKPAGSAGSREVRDGREGKRNRDGKAGGRRG